MGRRSWASADQLKFLLSYVDEIPQARLGSGQNVLYARVAQEFLTRWEPEPITAVEAFEAMAATSDVKAATSDAKTITPEKLKELAEARLYRVCFIFVLVFCR
jgi:hypothetical protein